MFSPAALLATLFAGFFISGCGGPAAYPPTPTSAPERIAPAPASEVVMVALGLMDTGYRFGGKNPEAGLDCSGMVSFVFERAVGKRLKGSAADIAKLGRRIDSSELRPGDLVFFNTGKQRYSHVGIYIGDGRFVHAPSSKGQVRTDSLLAGWFAPRFHEARTYFD
jgi:cell wall-associated NlpC family hydrolase